MAIDKRELRIGNWIQHRGDYCQVDAIEDYPNKKLIDAKSDRLSAHLDEEEFDPIPLSADLLLELGFEDADDDGTFYKYTFQYPDSAYPCYLSWGVDNHYIQICRNSTAAADVKCKYLHQLQNLVFSLTEKELTYTNAPSDK